MELNDSFKFENNLSLQNVHKLSYEVKQEVEKVIVGQYRMVQMLLVSMLSDGHVLLEGVPGVAKTLAAKTLARVIDVNFSRLQFTPDLMPSDVIGTSIFNPQQGSFSFKKGPIFGNVILIDEINRAPAKTQAALFEVMEERQITVDGVTYKMDEPFLVLATQNPIEQEGTYKLPEAQLDRFLFKINIDYPTLNEELKILEAQSDKTNNQILEEVRKVVSSSSLKEIKETVQQVKIDSKLLQYIANIVHQTRNNNALYLGASPRASLSIMKSSKAFAALQGRDFVIPEDIKFVAPYVLNHRIILTPEKEMEGLTTNAMVDSLIQGVEVPR